MSKHTPGPWKWEYDDGRPISLVSTSGDVLVCVPGYAFFSIGVGHADAAIIAEAPMLLEACEIALQRLDFHHIVGDQNLRDLLTTVIARAKGGAK